MNAEILTLQQLCELLQVSPNTVYAWRSKGEGPRAFKAGGFVRYRRADVEAWISAHLDPTHA